MHQQSTDHRGDDWIPTRSGKRFYPLSPRVEDIELVDIAAGLAARIRFSGQSRRHVTVAQHSVYCGQEVWRLTHDRNAALWGLLHDAAEAWLPDVCRPIKHRVYFRVGEGATPIPFRTIEHRILTKVAARFDLTYAMPKIVKQVDDRLLATERRDLFGPDYPDWKIDAEPFTWQIRPLLPDMAESLFLNQWDQLQGPA